MSAKVTKFEKRPEEHTTEMTIAEWIAVPDNPRQRDTERHLAKAKHLRQPSPTHSRVAMATWPNGRCKLDGHTRALGWQRGILPKPHRVVVSVYAVADMIEAVDLYRHFDAIEALETGADKVFGAYREIEFSPRSSLLKRGAITNAIRVADGLERGQRMPARDKNAYDLIARWRPELELLDGINPIRQRFPGPLIAAALLTFRKHGEAAREFWTLYNDDAGEKFESAMDAVETLSRFMLAARGGTTTSAAGTYDVVGKGLAAFEAHSQSRTYTRSFIAIDATKYLKRAA